MFLYLLVVKSLGRKYCSQLIGVIICHFTSLKIRHAYNALPLNDSKYLMIDDERWCLDLLRRFLQQDAECCSDIGGIGIGIMAHFYKLTAHNAFILHINPIDIGFKQCVIIERVKTQYIDA